MFQTLEPSPRLSAWSLLGRTFAVKPQLAEFDGHFASRTRGPGTAIPSQSGSPPGARILCIDNWRWRGKQSRSALASRRVIMMRIGQNRAQVPQVALLLETSTEYGRGLLRGILRFSRLHGPWSLCVAPGHFDQALPKAKSWKGTGIIARINSREMEARIGATGLPFVASSLFESSALLRAGHYGEIRTNSAEIGRMGALHLLDAGLHHFAFCGFGSCNWSAARETSFCETLRARSRTCSTHHITSANWRQRHDWIK